MKKILFILLFIPFISNAQFKIKEYKTSLILTGVSGLFDGFRDASQFGRIKNAGPYFNGLHSWKLKYKDGNPQNGPAFFGSTTFLVMLTDAPHLSNSISSILDGMAVSYAPKTEGTFGHKLLVTALYVVVKNIGHNIIYGIVFKPR